VATASLVFVIGEPPRAGKPRGSKGTEARYIHLVPTVFRHFASALTGDEAFPHLRLIKLGGEAVYAQDIDLYRRHFGPNCVLRVGMATTGAGSLSWYFVDKQTRIRNSIVPIGYAVEGKEILLLDEDRKPVKTGEVGEIAVRSRYLSPGYWRRPDLTGNRFLSDPHDPSKRIYLTGDLGRMGAGDCLEHLGRKDTQVKIRGLRIELGEVENGLLALDSVREAAVAAWPDEEHELQLVAYVVPSGETAPRSDRLRAALAETLPDFMIPSTFVNLDRLPLMPNGKLDRRALPAPTPAQNHSRASEQPFPDELEDQLVQIWQDVLDIRPLGVSDDFFELGGHSLQAMRLVVQIERVWPKAELGAR
jgi:acyl-coenzyme A synthetase/AMP-(fatty) acid ligase